jgi:hypothetical protein
MPTVYDILSKTVFWMGFDVPSQNKQKRIGDKLSLLARQTENIDFSFCGGGL